MSGDLHLQIESSVAIPPGVADDLGQALAAEGLSGFVILSRGKIKGSALLRYSPPADQAVVIVINIGDLDTPAGVRIAASRLAAALRARQ